MKKALHILLLLLSINAQAYLTPLYLSANQLQGTNVSATAPTIGQALVFNGTAWAPATGSASVSWGAITGTLSSQLDLQDALNLKADITSLDSYVPYTGATSDVDLGSHNLSANKVSAPIVSVGGVDLNYYLSALSVPSSIMPSTDATYSLGGPGLTWLDASIYILKDPAGVSSLSPNARELYNTGGSTMLGWGSSSIVASAALDMQSHYINNVNDPSNPQDAATKNYVDTNYLPVTGVLDLAHGGTNANLTAANGAIPYSTGSALAFLAPGSSGQIPRSGGAGAPSWSTATYPATTTANQLLYSSATNVIGGLSTAATSALVTNSSSVPSLTSGTTANRLLRTDGTTVSFAQAALATDVSGTLAIANGGTNNGSLTVTAGGVCYVDGSKIVTSAVGSANDVLTTNGTVPSFTSRVSLGATAATADTLVARDSSANGSGVRAGALTISVATTATAAGTTTLTAASLGTQIFTGSTTQTVKMPVVTTLAQGRQYTFINDSSGVVTVQSSGSNTIKAMSAGTMMIMVLRANSADTTAAPWAFLSN